jgi:hypothetical protein
MPNDGSLASWVESFVTTAGQSASLSWNKAPIWGLRPDFHYRQTVEGLLILGVLSDERTGLSFIIATDRRQRSHFRVWVSWDSLSYFTVSDSRLPFSSPPTTRRITVEVFDPASTRESLANELNWLFHNFGANRICHHVLQFLCYSVFLCYALPRERAYRTIA